MMIAAMSTKQTVSRGRCWGLLILVVVIFMATGCTKTSEAQEIADRFMDLYYAKMNVAEAVKLCSGAARNRLEGELQAIKGVRPDQPLGEPRVTFNLTAISNPSPTEATYTYRVTPHTSDVGNVVATLTLTDEDGHWTVTSISTQEGPPTS